MRHIYFLSRLSVGGSGLDLCRISALGRLTSHRSFLRLISAYSASRVRFSIYIVHSSNIALF